MAFLDHKYLDLVFTIFPLMDEETEAPRWKVTPLRSMGTQPMPVGAPTGIGCVPIDPFKVYGDAAYASGCSHPHLRFVLDD